MDTDAGRMYDAILAVFDRCGDVDPAMLTDQCKTLGLDPTAWMEYMEHGNPIMADNHAARIAEDYAVRGVIPELHDTADRLAMNETNVLEAADAAIDKLQGVRRMFIREKVKTGTEVALDLAASLGTIFEGGESGSVPFMLPEIDNVTGGIFPGNLGVIAAKEKHGKSTLLIQMIYAIAEILGIPVLLFSLEMKAREIMKRKACIDCNLRVIDVDRNKLSTEEQLAMLKRTGELSRLPVFIRDNAVTISDIQADAKRYVEEKGVKLIAVDYIQRVIPKATKGENREREVAAISSGLKTIALELDVPVLALSQVNEDFRARESRAIEQDMDKMILIGQRPELQDGQTKWCRSRYAKEWDSLRKWETFAFSTACGMARGTQPTHSHTRSNADD